MVSNRNLLAPLGVGPARGPWTNLGRLPLRVFSIGKYASPKKIRQLYRRRVTPFPRSQIWPFRLQIWTEGVLVEHPAPVFRRCNPALFRFKTDWTLLRDRCTSETADEGGAAIDKRMEMYLSIPSGWVKAHVQ